MPIYEYTCRICNNHFERLRMVSQIDEDISCPDCGSKSERQMSVFASFSVSTDGRTGPIANSGGGCCGGGCCGGNKTN